MTLIDLMTDLLSVSTFIINFRLSSLLAINRSSVNILSPTYVSSSTAPANSLTSKVLTPSYTIVSMALREAPAVFLSPTISLIPLTLSPLS